LIKRLPKLRGFNNRYGLDFVAVNLDMLERRFAAGAEVTPATLSAAGLLGKQSDLVVVLARGELGKPLHIKTHRISAVAKEKIEAAGGSVEMLPYTVNRNLPRS
jgi:large subunit ribosomal protein L15